MAESEVVVGTNSLSALYYVGNYDVEISATILEGRLLKGLQNRPTRHCMAFQWKRRGILETKGMLVPLPPEAGLLAYRWEIRSPDSQTSAQTFLV